MTDFVPATVGFRTDYDVTIEDYRYANDIEDLEVLLEPGWLHIRAEGGRVHSIPAAALAYVAWKESDLHSARHPTPPEF